MKKGLIKFCAYMLTSLALVVECIPTQAAESEEANYENAKEGVVQVNTVFVDANNEKHIICGGTGFIVGNSEETEYVITCNHIVNPDEETKEAAYTYLEIDNTDNAWENIDLSIEVVVEGDMVISASILNSSSDLDMAILQLEQPIYTRTPLTILTSENYEVDDLPYAIADVVYALGYPDGISYDSEVQYYSTEQVAMTAGKIVNLVSLNGVQVIESDALVAENNCGGPLVNENGYVIGMNLLTKDGMYSCALDSTKITKVLDGLGIEYTKINKDPEEEETKLVEQQDEQISETTEEDSNKIPTIVLIGICVFAVVIIGVLVTVIIIFVIKKDKSSNQKKEKQKVNSSIFSMDDSSESIKLKGSKNTITSNSSGSQLMSSDSDETTILSTNLFENDGETTLLSGELNTQRNMGTLIRRRTLENIPLNKPEFVLGKDALHADYCIDNNSSISRKHALISYGKNGVYIQDCNSTNGTYVNGIKLEGQRLVLLNSGDVIKLAKEEFEYRS